MIFTTRKAYGCNGVIEFDKLWKELKRAGKNKQWLIDNGIHRTTLYKLQYNENVTCEVIALLCKLLDRQPYEIMEYNSSGSPRPRQTRKTPDQPQTETDPEKRKQNNTIRNITLYRKNSKQKAVLF